MLTAVAQEQMFGHTTVTTIFAIKSGFSSQDHNSISCGLNTKIREGVKKNRIYLGLCPKLWVGGSRSRSKVPNFLVKISIQLFLLQTSRNVLKHVIHKWGGHIWPFHDALRPQRFWNFGILSEKFLIFSKK